MYVDEFKAWFKQFDLALGANPPNYDGLLEAFAKVAEKVDSLTDRPARIFPWQAPAQQQTGMSNQPNAPDPAQGKFIWASSSSAPRPLSPAPTTKLADASPSKRVPPSDFECPVVAISRSVDATRASSATTPQADDETALLHHLIASDGKSGTSSTGLAITPLPDREVVEQLLANSRLTREDD